MNLRGLAFVVGSAVALLLGAAPAQAAFYPIDPPDMSLRTGPSQGWTRRDSATPIIAADVSLAPDSESAGWMSKILPPVSTARHHTIQAGDTLFDISLYYGVGIDMINAANNFSASTVLQPGMDILIPASNLVGTAREGSNGPIVSGRGLHFVASMSQQACWLFQDSSVLVRWTCSTGRDSSPSAPGNYTVQSKIIRGYFIGAESWMPYWLGLYDAGGYENGIHGLPFAADTGEKFWTDKVGTPVTFGCIMLDDKHAKELFDVAYVGMPVTILR